MPINIPVTLPANSVLQRENIFVMDEERAVHQDIRPLKIAILNLMPKKIETETQILRLISKSPLQVVIDFLMVRSHESKNTSSDHLLKFYEFFDQVKDRYYDGMIITGAPVESLDYSQIDYWDELCRIMDWSLTNCPACSTWVPSTWRRAACSRWAAVWLRIMARRRWVLTWASTSSPTVIAPEEIRA